MRFQWAARDSWPELAWLATLRRGDSVIEVQHGRRVETADEWFGEIAWAGRYEDAAFDVTDIVAGSGARLRDNGVTFVPAGSTVDRLQSMTTDTATYVSNSLTCLLAATDASPIEPAEGYKDFFRDVLHGLAGRNRELTTSAGPLRLTYFHNLRWDGHSLTEAQKPFIERDFRSFQLYKGFMDDTMETFSANLRAQARRHPWRLLSSLSTGYDSPTVAAIARPFGLDEVLLFDSDRRDSREFHRGCQDSRVPSARDSGAPIAAAMGLRTLGVAHDAWMDGRLQEVPFLAADAYGQDVFFSSAGEHLSGTVLLTGFFGGGMWRKRIHDHDGNLARSDQSGLSLTDYRLSAGFLHAPIATWGARQAGDLYRISNSSELEPWDTPGDYSRPVCRRIIEEAGVPREAFGTIKLAGSLFMQDSRTFLSGPSMRDYRTWIDSHVEVFGDSALKRALGRQPWLDRAIWTALPYDSLINHAGLDGRTPSLAWRAAWRGRNQAYEIARSIPTIRQWVFPWAIDRSKDLYADSAMS